MMMDITEKEYRVIVDCMDMSRVFWDRVGSFGKAEDIRKVTEGFKIKYFDAKMKEDIKSMMHE